MIWLTADGHFGHENIIKYEHRPFSSVEEMDRILIRNINDLVGPDDELWYLGDFTMERNFGYVRDYREQILCHNIHFIRGNHDRDFSQAGVFSSWADYAEIGRLARDGYMACLSHYPYLSWNRMLYGTIMCHGHIHSQPEYNARNRAMGVRRYDVGVDANNFRPVALEDIVEFFADTEPIGYDGDDERFLSFDVEDTSNLL
jgi:calcineurin-like phosphoesterase family protein